MNQLIETFGSSAEVVVEALLNSLWQSVALIILVSAALRLARRSTAATRYLVWWTALLGALALIGIPRSSDPKEIGQHQQAGVAQPFTRIIELESRGGRHAPQQEPATPTSVNRSWFQPVILRIIPHWLALVLFAAILPLAAFRLAVICRGWRYLCKLKRSGSPCPSLQEHVRRMPRRRLSRRVTICLSGEVSTPVVAGLTRPRILVPDALIRKMPESELFSLLVHEIAHVRRFDDWTNLVQQLVEALFFFHPGIRWIGKRLSLEREIACDDWVIRVTGSPHDYAACLTRLSALGPLARSAPPLAQAALGGRKHISRRIEMLLRARNSARRISSLTVLFALLLLAAGMVVVRSAPVITMVEAAEGAQRASSRPDEPAFAIPAAPRLAASSPLRYSIVPPQESPKPQSAEKLDPQSREQIEKLTRERIELTQREIERRSRELESKQREIERITREVIEVRQREIERITRDIVEPKLREVERLTREIVEPKQRELERLIREQVEPQQRRLEAELDKNHGKTSEKLERLHKELNEKMKSLMGPRHNEIDKTVREQIEPLHREIDREVRESIEPLRQEIDKIIRDAIEPLHREMQRQVREQIEPLHRELEKMREMVERAVRQAEKKKGS